MSKKKKPHRLNENFLRRNKLLLQFLFVYIILSLLLFDPKLSTGGDNAVYIILAESIISGKGYKDIYLSEEPPHTQYPPGFPVLLTLPILLFGQSVIVLKFFIFLNGVGAVFFVFKIGEHLFKRRITIVMSFILSISIFIVYNHWILSEMPFLCFSLGALYFLMYAQEHGKFFYYFSFIFAMGSFFIRTAGISLILAIALFLLLKKQYKYFAIFLILFFSIFIPWQMRNAGIPGRVSYFDQLMAKNPYQLELGRASFFELLERAGDNFITYIFAVHPLSLFPLFKGTGPIPIVIIGAIFTPLIILCFVRRIRNLGIIELYFIITWIILLAWPRVWSSERFLLPILPLCIFYTYSSLFWLGKKFKLKHFIYVVTGLFVFLNLLYVIPQIEDALKNNCAYLRGDRYAGYKPDWRAYFGIIDLLKENVPEDKIILARKPEFVYLLSKCKSFIYPFTTDHDKVREAIKQSDYIIVDNLSQITQTERFLLPVLQEEPDNYILAGGATERGFYVLKVKNKGEF